MKRNRSLALTLTILLAPTPTPAAVPAAPQVTTSTTSSQFMLTDAFVDIPDFVFGDGEKIASVKLHYLTLGIPRRDASGAITNGVLLLHGTAGSAADLTQTEFFTSLYDAGQARKLTLMLGWFNLINRFENAFRVQGDTDEKLVSPTGPTA